MKFRRLWRVIGITVVLSGFIAGRVSAAGDVNRINCSLPTEESPGFRSFLPDCRAYEMVTPPYKNGAEVELLLKAISSDGTRLLGTSFGGFAGIANNEQGHLTIGAGIYEFRRSTAGWLTEPLQPPATQVSHSSFVAASSDLKHVLWELIEEPQPHGAESPPEKELLNSSTRYNLAVRVQEDSATPRFEMVGPENPSSQNVDRRDFTFEGASRDMSHVVFSIRASENDVWPGDGTQQGEGYKSLYEYVGTNNQEPLLVGIKNAGKLEGHPHINEGAELVSGCGTALGSPRVSSYNAVSATGETVVFTVMACSGGPSVNTLYARVSNEHTVAISEPERPISLQQGKGVGPEECDAVCEAALPAEASFQGASEDGKRIFFTTTQSLLNEDEAGAGSGNDLYEADLENGKLVRLVEVSHDAEGPAGVLGVARIAETGARVYYVAEGTLTGPNAEGKAPINGGDNLYVYDATSGVTKFVALLSNADSEDWKTEDEMRPAQATATGRFFVFPSIEKLTGAEDTSTASQLFEYDADADRIVRVSIGQQSMAGYFCTDKKRIEVGYNCNGNITNAGLAPVMPEASYGENTPPTEPYSKLAVTEDGRVFFMSLDALTPLSVEGSKNIYEFSHEDVSLIAVGENPQLELAAFQESFAEHDRLVSTDPTGHDVFFGAVGQLVPEDTDTQADVYDARAEGGFPDAVRTTECEGEACRRIGSAAPTLPMAPSATMPGESTQSSATVTPSKRLGNTRRLAQALKACKKRPRKIRQRCRVLARKRYAPSKMAAKRAVAGQVMRVRMKTVARVK